LSAGLGHIQLRKVVKKKFLKATRTLPAKAGLSDWPEHQPADSFQLYSQPNLDKLVADVELTIRDLPVWKDLVVRVGLREARKILRQGYLLRLFTDGNPQN
jgi:hypothetical protein